MYLARFPEIDFNQKLRPLDMIQVYLETNLTQKNTTTRNDFLDCVEGMSLINLEKKLKSLKEHFFQKIKFKFAKIEISIYLQNYERYEIPLQTKIVSFGNCNKMSYLRMYIAISKPSKINVFYTNTISAINKYLDIKMSFFFYRGIYVRMENVYF